MKEPTARLTTTNTPTTISEFSQREAERRANERLEREVSKAKRLESDLRDSRIENESLRQRLGVLQSIDSVILSAPSWQLAPSRKGLHHGIGTLFLSDCHFDEVVNPDEVEGVNEYSREIAKRRLKRVTSGAIDVARGSFNIKYDGFNLFLGGDLISGSIHDLDITNEDTSIGTVDYWADHLVEVVGSLVEEFGRLHVSVVVGNHGRNTHKPRNKLRVRDNFDWLLCRIVARYFAQDSRITWQIPESADALVQIYDEHIRLTHGDQFRGGSGISGMLAPLMLGSFRKTMRQATLGNPHSLLCMGHHHNYWCGKGIIVNNCLKGYDEYAYVSNFAFSKPSQAFFIITPKRGLTFPCEIWAE